MGIKQSKARGFFGQRHGSILHLSQVDEDENAELAALLTCLMQ